MPVLCPMVVRLVVVVVAVSPDVPSEVVVLGVVVVRAVGLPGVPLVVVVELVVLVVAPVPDTATAPLPVPPAPSVEEQNEGEIEIFVAVTLGAIGVLDVCL